MTVPVIVSPEAEADVVETARWYDEHHSGLGREFVLEVDRMFERISNWPESHAEVYRMVRLAIIKRFPYVVGYQFDGIQIHVICVFHAHRDPDVWLSRLQLD